MSEETKTGGVADGMIVEGGSSFIKGADFDGAGLTLEVVSMAKYTPEDPKYGANHTYGAGGKMTKENWFVKNELLSEGDTFRYTFLDEGEERVFDNSSVGFYFAFTKVNPKKGDTVFIKRDKKSDTKVDWTVEVK